MEVGCLIRCQKCKALWAVDVWLIVDDSKINKWKVTHPFFRMLKIQHLQGAAHMWDDVAWCDYWKLFTLSLLGMKNSHKLQMNCCEPVPSTSSHFTCMRGARVIDHNTSMTSLHCLLSASHSHGMLTMKMAALEMALTAAVCLFAALLNDYISQVRNTLSMFLFSIFY